MDTLYIKDLKLEAKIGCLAWEQTIAQPIVLNIHYKYDTKHAQDSDELANALDYTALVESIRTFLKTKQFNLIEHLANALTETLFTQFPQLQEIQLQLAKPHILPNTKEIGIIIQRTQTK